MFDFPNCPELPGATRIGERLVVQLAEAAPRIRDADLFLHRRPRSPIAIAGRSDYSHASKAAWWGGDLFCVEVREWHGGRAVTVESQVRRRPGCIDVYQSNPDGRWPEYDRFGSSRYMRRLCGGDYGYWGIVWAALLHLPVVRLCVSPVLDDQAVSRRPPFCSQACAMADRIGGNVDPVPHLADQFVEPADLARSPFYRYLFTLI